MILSRITSKSQTTVPRAVRAALGLEPGDTLAYRIEDGEVWISKAKSADPAENAFASFTEWADELDQAYDDL
jgi:antitoxin PrlF